MQSFYIFIALVGFCAYLAQKADETFMGASRNAKTFLMIGAFFGYLSFIALLVAALFFAPWWHIIILGFVAVPVLMATLGSLFVQKPLIRVVAGAISCIGVIIFNVFAWTAML